MNTSSTNKAVETTFLKQEYVTEINSAANAELNSWKIIEDFATKLRGHKNNKF